MNLKDSYFSPASCHRPPSVAVPGHRFLFTPTPRPLASAVVAPARDKAMPWFETGRRWVARNWGGCCRSHYRRRCQRPHQPPTTPSSHQCHQRWSVPTGVAAAGPTTVDAANDTRRHVCGVFPILPTDAGLCYHQRGSTLVGGFFTILLDNAPCYHVQRVNMVFFSFLRANSPSHQRTPGSTSDYHHRVNLTCWLAFPSSYRMMPGSTTTNESIWLVGWLFYSIPNNASTPGFTTTNESIWLVGWLFSSLLNDTRFYHYQRVKTARWLGFLSSYPPSPGSSTTTNESRQLGFLFPYRPSHGSTTTNLNELYWLVGWAFPFLPTDARLYHWHHQLDDDGLMIFCSSLGLEK